MSKQLKIETIEKRVHLHVQKALAKGYYLKACWRSGGEDGRRCLLTAIVESETRGTNGTVSKMESKYGWSAAQSNYTSKAGAILGLTHDETKALESGFEGGQQHGGGERGQALYDLGDRIRAAYNA